MLSRAFVATLLLSLVVADGPCDIYASGGTPCVAAHSTTRALFSSFSGALYQVQRASDSATIEISPLSAGGIADADAQDTFCANTTCLITIVYDQSTYGNHLTQGPPGGFDGPDVDGYDNLASAIGAPVTLNGQKAYGIFVAPGTGYRIELGNGVATGNDPEGMYAVLDGTHYNDNCCFDYGNAETSSTDTGDAHMEAIYYGTCSAWSSGDGDGPWIMADLENGLFSGYSPDVNSKDPSISYRFVTAVVKGEPNEWAILGGDATSGSLTSYYDGIRPDGYEPMYKEGSIVLGIGGDNSNSAQGTFYEGAITTGYPSDEVDALVQANIVAAGYGTTSLTSGTALTVDSTISFHVTTPGYTTRYIAHSGVTVNTQEVTSSSDTNLKEQASWRVRTGLGNSDCFSFESVDTPGSFIRHQAFSLIISANDGTKQFYEDATYCPQTGLKGEGDSVRSWSYPTRYFRHYNNVLFAASNGGVHDFDNANEFTDDVSFLIESGFVS